MTTAIIKLNSLPDTIRPAAQDNYLFAICRRGFVFLFIRGVEVGREALELSGTGIDALINWLQTGTFTLLADCPSRHFLTLPREHTRKSLVAVTHPLRLTKIVVSDRRQILLLQRVLLVGDLLQLLEEPAVHAGHLMDLLDWHSSSERVPDIRQPFGMWRDQPLPQNARLD